MIIFEIYGVCFGTQPGGGKDEVLKYLNESKKQVEIAEKALKTIIETIGLSSS